MTEIINKEEYEDDIESCKGCVYEGPTYLPQPDFCKGCMNYPTSTDNYFNPKEK